MSDAGILLGPLGITAVALLARRRLTPGWGVWIAVWVGLDTAVTLALTLPAIGRGEWGAIFLAVTNLVALTSVGDSVLWLREHTRVAPHRYYFWWSLFWAALLGIALSKNLALSWLAVEFSTLASAALIIEMGGPHALEAGWKYIVIASVGLILALTGIVFIYATLRYQGLSWATLDFSNLHAQYPQIAPVVQQLGAILLVSGFGTKAGLVPFHTWLPDAHSEAPSPVSGLLSGVLLGLSLFTVARAVGTVPTGLPVYFSVDHLLTLFGAISVVVGALALLVQQDIKRLLAYSSIEQVGMMAVALGLGSRAAVGAALMQFVLHAVIKSSLFYGAGHLSVRYGTKGLSDITSLWARHRLGALLWTLGILALAGVPPLGLAYSEWLILDQLWLHHAYLVVAVVSVSLTISFAALAHHLIHNLWGAPHESAEGQAPSDKLDVQEVI
ncbi:MAG: hypothetical protein K6U87_05705 [Firmicutes bacterium]|nr:hypothetical protein [Bacillota bacterium]